jgi:phospholipase/lecithinase/hemolysin
MSMVGKIGIALASVVALGIGFCPAESRAGFSQIVAFGDSLLDTGNVFAATGSPPAPYYQGHYSNGIIWIERLADQLGLARPTPSLLGGTDNAWGGAETGLTGNSVQGTPNIGTQITSYFAAGHTVDASQLIVVWGGGNDFLNAGQTNPAVPVTNLITELTTLIAAGGTHFLVPNLPQLGLVPLDPSVTPAARAGLDALTLAFNSILSAQLTALQASHPGVTIAQLDIEGLVRSVTNNPAANGFTNVTGSALQDGVLSGAGYLYWDQVHPTTNAGALIANAALAAVPEPSSMALMVVAGVSLLACRGVGRNARKIAA